VPEFTVLLAQVSLTDTQLADVLRVFDTDGSGSVDYAEFAHSVEDSLRVEAPPVDVSVDGAADASVPGVEEEFEAELLEKIRSKVWNKYGSAQNAWKAYHVAHGRKPYVRRSTLLSRLRAEGFPSLTSPLLGKLLENHGVDSTTLDYSQFRRFLSSPLPDADETSHAMGNTPRVRAPASLGMSMSSMPRMDFSDATPQAVTVDLLKELGDRLARTSKSSRDVHNEMKRHGTLGCTSEDLAWGFHKLGRDLTPEEASGLIDHYDDDRDGMLSFAEFLELVRDTAMAAGTM